MLIRRIYSTLFWGFILVTSILLFPLAVLLWAVTAPFDPHKRALHQFTCFWGSLYTWVNPLWPVTVEGRERIEKDQTYVMVANHLSLLDILVLFRLFRHFTWVSKVENFQVPLIGWNMSLNGYIPLRRGDRESIAAMMVEAEEVLRSGSSVMMFPEGTRSRDGEMRPFKPGAFELALRTGLPVLPILIEGSYFALPRRGFVLQGKHPILIRVLEPLEPEPGESAQDLSDRTREVLASAQAEARDRQ